MSGDLHIHTRYSSAPELTPRKVVEDVKNFNKLNIEGIYTIAITDHQNLQGIQEARIAAGCEIRVIGGIEIKTYLPIVGKCDILGYGVEGKSRISNFVKKLSSRQLDWSKKILEKLEASDVQIDRDSLKKQGLIDERYLSEIIAEAGYANTWDEAMRKYLDVGRPGYVELKLPSTISVIKMLHENRALPVLAHPIYFGSEMLNAIEYLTSPGESERIEGIEVYHPAQSNEMRNMLASKAKERNLLIFGGSDAHGPGSRYPKSIGEAVLPNKEVEIVIEKLDKNGE